MLFNHGDVSEPIDKQSLSKELAIGSLFINFNSKILYTKNLTSNILDVGTSKRYLSQFPQYEVGYEAIGQTSIVQFSNINGELKLTSKYPFFYLSQLTDSNIDLNTQDTTNQWLGFNSGKIVNTTAPSFRIIDLTEVSNLTLNASVNNFALTSVTSFSGFNFNKNPFVPLVYLSWILQPENTRITTFDDVLSSKVILDSTDANSVLRTTAIGETSRALRVDQLHTRSDTKPNLSNNLDCLGNSIYNVSYPTQRFILNIPKTTIVCDCDNYKNFVIVGNGSTTIAIEMSFNTSISLASSGYIPFALTIENFNGIVTFDKKVEFENGEPLYLEGLNHMIVGYILISDSIYRIRVLQKVTNLKGVL